MINTDLETVIANFELFAKNFLVIKPKNGQSCKFTLNYAQRYVNSIIQQQLASTGKVRIICLKGRQLGLSTMIQARFFWKVITTPGLHAYILTHEAEATSNLFGMAARFYVNLPAGLCPQAENSTQKKLYFKEFDSGYSVGTAGNKGAGRSQTIQLFHGSEVAFWPHAEEHQKGVLEAVANVPGTEIILESTANGIGNTYHDIWTQAETGRSEFKAIFVPWYWDPNYVAGTEGFIPDDEEKELFHNHQSKGLTLAHLAWRRIKINRSKDRKSAILRFHQEYPMTAQEAFLNPVGDTFINSDIVYRAMQNSIGNIPGRVIIGVDPAIGDNDRSAIIRRVGRKAYGLETFYNHNTMETAGRIKKIIDKEKPFKVFIDCIGVGAGVTDRLLEMGYQNIVVGVNVARSASDPEYFKNLRAELWSEMRDWFSQSMDVEIPDSDELHADLCSCGYKYPGGQLLIESKEQMKKRGLRSSDCADSLMLTFFDGYYADNAGTDITYLRPPKAPQADNLFS